jgi:hypothetical protein
VPRIVELLGEPQVADHAAANPALPIPVMERVLAEAASRLKSTMTGPPAGTSLPEFKAAHGSRPVGE